MISKEELADLQETVLAVKAEDFCRMKDYPRTLSIGDLVLFYNTWQEIFSPKYRMKLRWLLEVTEVSSHGCHGLIYLYEEFSTPESGQSNVTVISSDYWIAPISRVTPSRVTPCKYNLLGESVS